MPAIDAIAQGLNQEKAPGESPEKGQAENRDKDRDEDRGKAHGRGPGPEYQVLRRLRKDLELRQYESVLVAEVEVSGEERSALDEGFRILADYIFGKNKPKKTMDMTSPVVAHRETIKMTAPVTLSHNSGMLKVSFFMPQNYTVETLPEPQDSRVHIVQLPERKLAALRFSGSWSPQSFSKHAAELQNQLKLHQISSEGKPFYAYYDPPWTPSFIRRNEVLISITD